MRDKYDIKQVIGRGAYATTRMCVEKATGKHFAVKSITKKGLSSDEKRRIRREMQVMYHLSGAQAWRSRGGGVCTGNCPAPAAWNSSWAGGSMWSQVQRRE